MSASSVLPDGFWTRLASALPGWLSAQRWFAAKNQPIARVDVLPVADLAPGFDDGPGCLLTVARVRLPDAIEDYQIPVGLRRGLPTCLESALITRIAGMAAYDATADAELMSRILALINNDAEIGGVSFHREERWSTVDLIDGLSPRASGAEQSNTSVVFGERYILKLFRRLSPGINPDVAVHRALQWAGCAHIARLVGTISARSEGQPVTLGMLQCFAADAQDGWDRTLQRTRAVAAGKAVDADDVHELGAAVATVHRDLATQLGTERWGAAALAKLAAGMRANLNGALRAVPPLARYRERLYAAFDEVGELSGPVTAQRIHGDLHLGQVLRCVAPQSGPTIGDAPSRSRWLILDFEGEPAAPMSRRTARHSVLRDVAGMLRSFDYAASHVRHAHADILDGDPEADQRIERWARRQRELFRDGYEALSGLDLTAHAPLLRAYELEKAVYETVYEARHRPDWLPVPLAALDRLLAPVSTP